MKVQTQKMERKEGGGGGREGRREGRREGGRKGERKKGRREGGREEGGEEGRRGGGREGGREVGRRGRAGGGGREEGEEGGKEGGPQCIGLVINTKEAMLQTVFPAHVARSAQVVVKASHTPPQHPLNPLRLAPQAAFQRIPHSCILTSQHVLVFISLDNSSGLFCSVLVLYLACST